MSDNIPFEILVEILKRLPIRSLIQFRSVSKAWKSLIDSSDFIAGYSSQQQHLLVRYEEVVNLEQKYVSVVDDGTFPHRRVSLTIPQLVKMFQHSSIIGSSHGLLCLYGGYRKSLISGTKTAVIWNPSIKKAVAVVVPNVADYKGIYETDIGFGVCRETIDPKIVKITHIYRWGQRESISCTPWQVEVFALSTRAWRSPFANNIPQKSVRFGFYQVVVDGCLYWLTNNRITESTDYELIISFDMTSEEFKEVNLPDSLAYHSRSSLSMYKPRESLAVVESGVKTTSVWMMEDGVSKSFTKLFTFNSHTPDLSSDLYVMGFRKTGEPVIKIVPYYGEPVGSLVVYEPYSKSINIMGVNGRAISFHVYSYMETLLLL